MVMVESCNQFSVPPYTGEPGAGVEVVGLALEVGAVVTALEVGAVVVGTAVVVVGVVVTGVVVAGVEVVGVAELQPVIIRISVNSRDRQGRTNLFISLLLILFHFAGLSK